MQGALEVPSGSTDGGWARPLPVLRGDVPVGSPYPPVPSTEPGRPAWEAAGAVGGMTFAVLSHTQERADGAVGPWSCCPS